MISRRLIRIKAFKTLFSFEGSGMTDVAAGEANLIDSCDKVRELYYFLLNISSSITDLAFEKIEAGLRKFHPTEQEANPNYKFANNRFAKLVETNPEVGRFCQKRGLVWREYDVFIKKLFNSIISKEYYRNYMNSGEDSFEEDCDLFSCIFQEEFEDNEDLQAILEDMSILWIDDVAYVLNAIIDGIKQTRRTRSVTHVTTFTNEDDKAYAVRLFEEAAIKYDEFLALVSSRLDNWRSDRVVSTDAVLIVLGITEAVTFPTIPVKVTINEYVEIAKYYSTPNSRIFVNGLLDAIIQEKIKSGEIVKLGRGLLEC